MATATNDQAITRLKNWAIAYGSAGQKLHVTNLIDKWNNGLAIKTKFNNSFSDYIAAENDRAKRIRAVIKSAKSTGRTSAAIGY